MLLELCLGDLVALNSNIYRHNHNQLFNASMQLIKKNQKKNSITSKWGELNKITYRIYNSKINIFMHKHAVKNIKHVI